MTAPGYWTLQPGDVTTRAALGAEYAGNQQAGIAHSAKTPNIMLFSDPDATESPGYAYDGWVGDVYQYTGEGKRGDQQMTNGNKALRDHAKTKRAVRVFVADGTVSKKSNAKRQRYVGEFKIDTNTPYSVREARDVDGIMRKAFVFNLLPLGGAAHHPQDENAYSGANEVEPVGVHAVPTEATDKTTYEYQQVGTKKARKREAELTDRFERYLVDVHHHEVTRYKIATAGSSGNQFTDLADATAKVLYEAKGITNRMSVRLALGQVLDYGRYVKKNYPGNWRFCCLNNRRPT